MFDLAGMWETAKGGGKQRHVDRNLVVLIPLGTVPPPAGCGLAKCKVRDPVGGGFFMGGWDREPVCQFPHVVIVGLDPAIQFECHKDGLPWLSRPKGAGQLSKRWFPTGSARQPDQVRA